MKKYNLSSVNINNKDIKSVIKNLKSGWLAYGKKSIELDPNSGKGYATLASFQ